MKRGMVYGLLVCLLGGAPVRAGVEGDLQAFFNGLGSMSNVSGPGVFADQAGGHATGGSLVMRNRIRSIQPLSVDLPSFKAGCGGIDLFTGGLSYIRKEALVNALKSIGSNALTYATMLGIQTVSPQIANLLGQLQSWAQWANNLSVNSCETAQGIVGGLWPKTEAASQKICQDAGSAGGLWADRISARHACGTGGETARGLKSAREGEYKDILVSNTNMAWHILKDHPLLSGDTELAEFMMSISGTLVIRTGSERSRIQVLPSLAHQDDLVRALMEGGDVELYACDEHEACLNPTLKKRTFPESKAFLQVVRKILVSLQEKMDEEKAKTTEKEKDFIGQTSIPVFYSINVNSAFRKGKGPIDIDEYADFIAIEIVHKYLNETLDVVHKGLQRLKNAQVDGSTLETFESGINRARGRIKDTYFTELTKLTSILKLVEKTKLVEEQLHAIMGRGGFHAIGGNDH